MNELEDAVDEEPAAEYPEKTDAKTDKEKSENAGEEEDDFFRDMEGELLLQQGDEIVDKRNNGSGKEID